MKLDFPKFDGFDPLQWLFRAEQFSSYYETSDAQKLTIVAVHFEGPVVPWFQMLQKANLIPTWAALAQAIEKQFGPSQFDSPRAQLFKLSQTNSVADYYTQFMTLANRVEGLTEPALLDCFISGLWDPIRRDVIAQSPPTLLRAVSLACLFDEKVSWGLSSGANRTTHSPSVVKSMSSSNPQQLPPLLPKPTTKPLPPIKCISPAEMQIRQEKGLCFTCDEKYFWKHVCPNKHLMLFLSDLDGSELPSSEDSMAPPSLV